MIRIGETHYCHMISGGQDVPGANDATEAVKRLVEAARTVCEAAHIDDRYSAIVHLGAAVAPFTESDR